MCLERPTHGVKTRHGVRNASSHRVHMRVWDLSRGQARTGSGMMNRAAAQEGTENHMRNRQLLPEALAALKAYKGPRPRDGTTARLTNDGHFPGLRKHKKIGA